MRDLLLRYRSSSSTNEILWEVDKKNWYLTIKRLWTAREHALNHPDSAESKTFIRQMSDFVRDSFDGRILRPLTPLTFYPLLAIFSRHVKRMNKQCNLVVTEILINQYKKNIMCHFIRNSYTENQMSEPTLTEPEIANLLSIWRDTIISDLENTKELDADEVDAQEKNVQRFLKSAGLVLELKLDEDKTDQESPRVLIMLFNPLTSPSWSDNYITTENAKRIKLDPNTPFVDSNTPFVYGFYIDPSKSSPIRIAQPDHTLPYVVDCIRASEGLIKVLKEWDQWLRGETVQLDQKRQLLFTQLKKDTRLKQIADLIKNNPP